MDQQVEVWKMFRQTQEKYVYFILSLSIAAVAFAVATTDRTAFKWSHVLLGLAVGSWLIAIYFGIRWNKWNISTLFANHELLRVQSGKHLTDMQIPPGYEAAAIEGIRKAMNTNADDLKNSFDRQGLAFYTGIFFFITWHLWEMLTATI
jgi:hypothetical protein